MVTPGAPYPAEMLVHSQSLYFYSVEGATIVWSTSASTLLVTDNPTFLGLCKYVMDWLRNAMPTKMYMPISAAARSVQLTTGDNRIEETSAVGSRTVTGYYTVRTDGQSQLTTNK